MTMMTRQVNNDDGEVNDDDMKSIDGKGNRQVMTVVNDETVIVNDGNGNC